MAIILKIADFRSDRLAKFYVLFGVLAYVVEYWRQARVEELEPLHEERIPEECCNEIVFEDDEIPSEVLRGGTVLPDLEGPQEYYVPAGEHVRLVLDGDLDRAAPLDEYAMEIVVEGLVKGDGIGVMREVDAVDEKGASVFPLREAVLSGG